LNCFTRVKALSSEGLSNQDLKTFVELESKYYPNLVKVFYAKVSSVVGVFNSKVKELKLLKITFGLTLLNSS